MQTLEATDPGVGSTPLGGPGHSNGSWVQPQAVLGAVNIGRVNLQIGRTLSLSHLPLPSQIYILQPMETIYYEQTVPGSLIFFLAKTKCIF